MLEGVCHCGETGWTLKKMPASATACNCTICRRYGVLWAYGHIDHDIISTGSTTAYRRDDSGDIDFHFCGKCGCVTHYIATTPGQDGRHWTAVNLRMTDPTPILALQVNHFDGHKTFQQMPPDGRTLQHMWF